MKKTVVYFVLAVYFVSFVGAFGVVSPYWPGNPLVIFPGETKTLELKLQNMAGVDDLNVRVVLDSGSEIATISEGDYLVKAGTKNTEIPVTISIPSETPVGAKYVVTVSFKALTSGDDGGIVIGTGMDTSFDVFVGVPEKKPLRIFWWVIGAVIVIAFVVWFFRRMKK